MSSSKKAASKSEDGSSLSDSEKRLIEFLVKQAIKQAVRSCT
jgi:hypothetical protein